MSPYPLHTILFLDIETVSQYPVFSDLPEDWQELWRHKADSLMRDKAPVGPEELYGRAAIYAEFSKIHLYQLRAFCPGRRQTGSCFSNHFSRGR